MYSQTSIHTLTALPWISQHTHTYTERTNTHKHIYTCAHAPPHINRDTYIHTHTYTSNNPFHLACLLFLLHPCYPPTHCALSQHSNLFLRQEIYPVLSLSVALSWEWQSEASYCRSSSYLPRQFMDSHGSRAGCITPLHFN